MNEFGKHLHCAKTNSVFNIAIISHIETCPKFMLKTTTTTSKNPHCKNKTRFVSFALPSCGCCCFKLCTFRSKLSAVVVVVVVLVNDRTIAQRRVKAWLGNRARSLSFFLSLSLAVSLPLDGCSSSNKVEGLFAYGNVNNNQQQQK